MDKVFFSYKACISIKREISKYPEVETGGAMLGFKDLADNSFHVTVIIDGGPKAIRERYSFKCDLDYSNMMIDKLISNSDGNLQYIGEWHSHPQIEPYPSSVDLDSLYNMANSHTEEVLMVIFGFINFSFEKIENQSIALIYDIHQETFYKIPLTFIDQKIS